MSDGERYVRERSWALEKAMAGLRGLAASVGSRTDAECESARVLLDEIERLQGLETVVARLFRDLGVALEQGEGS